MKTFITALLFFLLGIGALYAYNNYQAMVQENKNFKLIITVSPTPPTMATVTPTRASQLSIAKGEIKGTLGYPAEGIPELNVYAFDTSNEKTYFMIDTKVNQDQFTISDVDPGNYYIVAYVKASKTGEAYGGGYTKAVSCGLSVNCLDHSLIAVTVKPGETATGVEVKDWYAPEGIFPKKP